ncbi:hypothetical protein BJ170DRAFT_60169 [Xylariales sp. AK1849]|nr:hypothetical protein BJ170DRAFT_60169 [Xylariales sp. AK1849]
MLAIQRPRMGSSQPPDGTVPFGYSLNRGDDLLFFEPPEPAPGDPLLSYEESQSLNSLLDQLTSIDHHNMALGEGLNFSETWQSLPPQFLGTATSYGHHPAQPFPSSMFDFSDSNGFDASHFTSSSMPPPPPPQLRHQPRTPSRSANGHSTPADAAAVLTALQSGQAARSNGLGRGSNLSSHGVGRAMGHPISQPQTHFGTGRSSPMRSVPIPATVAPLTEHRDEHLFTEMAFGNPHGPGSQRVVQQVPEDVRWGSDMNFGRGQGQGFVPSSQRDTSEVLESEHIKYLGCLQYSNSAANTRPSSPLGSGHNSPIGGRNVKLNGHTLPNDFEGPPRKRRKSKVKEEAEEDDGDVHQKPAARKRKSKEDLNGSDEASSSLNDIPGKRRRKSNVNGSKPPRENLSDSQKRANHIRSEQKRRTLIKEGFDDLTEIVPNLKNGGYSKSAMLQMAGEWLDELIKGNEMLS